MLAPSSVDKGDVEKAADKPESENKTLSMLAPSSVDKGDVEKAADKPESVNKKTEKRFVFT